MMTSRIAIQSIVFGTLSQSTNADWNPASSVSLCPPSHNGFLPLPGCTSYINCWGGTLQYKITCPEGLLYDENRGYCHDSVKCNVLNDAGNPTLVIDVVSDVVCPDYHSGRLGVDDCSAYVDCVNGFEVGRERCDEGTMYSTSTENCERDVTECSSIVSMGDAVKEGNGCGEGQCFTADGECAEFASCFIDPCESIPCNDNEICEASYCGGCDAVCSLQLNVAPQLIDDSGMYLPEKDDGSLVVKSSDVPKLIDDSGMWPIATMPTGGTEKVPDIALENVQPAPSTMTTAATATATKTTVPTVLEITSPGQFYPDWEGRSCNPKDDNAIAKVGQWYSYYPSIFNCCVANFLSDLQTFKACLDFDIETLEPPQQEGGLKGTKVKYYPNWDENTCNQEDGSTPEWVKSTLKGKKYLCCFEFFKWAFSACMKDA